MPPTHQDRIKNWERYGLKSWIEAAKRRLHHNVLAWARRIAKLNKANISIKKRDTSDRRALTQKYCLKGVHLMNGDNVMIVNNIGHRRCRVCHYAAAAGHPMPPEKVEEIKAAVANGATFNQICNGIPAGGGDRSVSCDYDRAKIAATAQD